MKNFIRRIIYSLPPVRNLRLELEKYRTYHPPGHYYSPIPDQSYIKANATKIFDRAKKVLPGIDMRSDEQKKLLYSFAEHYGDIPFPENKQGDFRYWFKNGLFSYSDSIFLTCMIRNFKPHRIIEAGSGYSSAAMLDINERYFNNEIEMTFVEPYPVTLNKLTEGFPKNFTVIPGFVQDVKLETFSTLKENDILFIDSTHVAKAGSDVNYILFEILPSLNKGVIIHFHDVFYPFEYPQQWIEKGFAWNEDYMLRAFLMYNNAFEILFFNSYAELFENDWISANMPKVLLNPGGGLWLRKK